MEYVPGVVARDAEIASGPWSHAWPIIVKEQFPSVEGVMVILAGAGLVMA